MRLPFPYPLAENRSAKESESTAIAMLENTLKAHHHEIAGLVIEPLMQGAAGMVHSSHHYLQKVRDLTKTYDVLLIADEVATGFGRTGAMFACQKVGIEPDILCIAKGISGGYLPLAATLTSEVIFEAFLGDPSENKTFFHGHTYTANPLACAAAIASLEIFEHERTLEKLQTKIEQLTAGLIEINDLEWVAEVRQEGFMVGIELQGFEPNLRMGSKVCDLAIEKGVFLRPLGDVIVLMPPLSITKNELHLLLETTKTCIISCCGH
jgi:adenosylmethionine-8-amino-7-oxononanoate aminotransferase